MPIPSSLKPYIVVGELTNTKPTDPNVIINYQYSYSGGSAFPNPPINNPQYVIMKAIGFVVVNSPTMIYGLSDDGIGIGYSNSGGSLILWLGGSSTSNNLNNIINAWVGEGATQYSGMNLISFPFTVSTAS